MAGILWRVLMAVIAVVLVYALIPPFTRIIGFGINADLMLIIKVCVAGLALFYVFKGSPPA